MGLGGSGSRGSREQLFVVSSRRLVSWTLEQVTFVRMQLRSDTQTWGSSTLLKNQRKENQTKIMCSKPAPFIDPRLLSSSAHLSGLLLYTQSTDQRRSIVLPRSTLRNVHPGQPGARGAPRPPRTRGRLWKHDRSMKGCRRDGRPKRLEQESRRHVTPPWSEPQRSSTHTSISKT